MGIHEIKELISLITMNECNVLVYVNINLLGVVKLKKKRIESGKNSSIIG